MAALQARAGSTTHPTKKGLEPQVQYYILHTNYIYICVPTQDQEDWAARLGSRGRGRLQEPPVAGRIHASANELGRSGAWHPRKNLCCARLDRQPVASRSQCCTFLWGTLRCRSRNRCRARAIHRYPSFSRNRGRDYIFTLFYQIFLIRFKV